MSQQLLPFAPLLLMSVDEIWEKVDQRLLEQLKEDRRLERKPPGIQPRELSAYFSMWANTRPDGGLIAVGIADDGSVVGVSSAGQNRINDLEKTGMTYCQNRNTRADECQ